MIIRIAVCDVCGLRAEEPGPGYGWQGWGSFKGIALNGVADPMLCPTHKAALADALDAMTATPKLPDGA